VPSPRQVLRNPQIAFDEGLVDDHPGRDSAQLRHLHLLSHRLEVPLHPVNTDRDGVHQRKALRVFGQERLEVANNMAKLRFEFSVPILRTRGMGIVEY
jgi:hypothetical protein